MKTITSDYRFIEEVNHAKKIERVARICYKSEDKITSDSAKKMVDNLIKRKHYAMLEHASVGFIVNKEIYENILTIIMFLLQEGYKCFLRFSCCKINTDHSMERRYIVSGNIRAWIEFLENVKLYQDTSKDFFLPSFFCYKLCKILKDFDFSIFDEIKTYDEEYQPFIREIKDYSTLTDKERLIHETVSILFTVNRGVTHELVRMRDCSFAQESTRYCSYDKDKFGNEITVIEPKYLFNKDMSYKDGYSEWAEACNDGEKQYFELLEKGYKAQEARDVLPHALKAEIVMTTTLQSWKHILELRACRITGAPAPQMLEVMVPVLKEMQERYPNIYHDLKPYEI